MLLPNLMQSHADGGSVTFDVVCRVAFPRERQLRQSRATQPTVHAGCFSVSIIHRTLTWTTGALTYALMLMHAIAHGVVRTHVRESALKVDSGRKIPCRTRESNLSQQRAGPTLYRLSYIPRNNLCYFWNLGGGDLISASAVLRCQKEKKRKKRSELVDALSPVSH